MLNGSLKYKDLEGFKHLGNLNIVIKIYNSFFFFFFINIYCIFTICTWVQ
jgi:hypothetical protein